MGFAYSNIYYSLIEMEPFEALNNWYYRSLIRLFETLKVWPRGINLLQELLDSVRVIKDALRGAQSRQKVYADLRLHVLRF